MPHLEDGVNKIIPGIKSEGHCCELGFGRVLQLDIEAQPLGSVFESLSQGGYPASLTPLRDSSGIPEATAMTSRCTGSLMQSGPGIFCPTYLVLYSALRCFLRMFFP